MFVTPASHGSFAQLVHVSAANAQRRTQTFMSTRLGANPIPIRNNSFTVVHSLMELASLLAVAYEAAANASLRLKKRGRNHERQVRYKVRPAATRAIMKGQHSYAAKTFWP
jgi:hypothetical protein